MLHCKGFVATPASKLLSWDNKTVTNIVSFPNSLKCQKSQE